MPRLALSGGPEDVFCIGDDVTVKIVVAKHGYVRLVFEAPPNVEIDRQRVRLKKDAERRARS